MKIIAETLNNLSPRERWMVIGGGLAAAAIVLYALVWQPWQTELERLRAQVPEKEETLAWMRAQARRVEALPAANEQAEPTSGLPLLTLVERSASRTGMREAITRMSPGEQAEQVRVWIDDTAFDDWLHWVDVLTESGVEVAEASIDRSGDNLVGIRATLQR